MAWMFRIQNIVTFKSAARRQCSLAADGDLQPYSLNQKLNMTIFCYCCQKQNTSLPTFFESQTGNANILL